MSHQIASVRQYCNSLVKYSRRKTIEVKIGDVPLGATNPIRIQSMTTVDTMDTKGSVEQSIRMIEAGCEYVRITAPSVKEAQNLEVIKKELRRRGYPTPLVADIHFTPNAAELAARIVEKVRINPGNYADKKRFETIEYTDAEYEAELDRIRQKFTPLVKICKEYGTAMRIGTNHGSLSDRIMSRYGDSPLGMVESALEFLRICGELNYHDIVLSMKSSNPQVMVQAYRLLVQKLDEEGFKPYPLHLGVTEAGDGEDGRIKSSVGIGTLLEDGLGDTVRVSLTEEPEVECPVAKVMVDRYVGRENHQPIKLISESPINPFEYNRRAVREVINIGGHHHVPRVIADLSDVVIDDYKDLRCIGHFYLPEPDKWRMNDQGADYVYTGNRPIPFMLPNGLKEITDYSKWIDAEDKINRLPLFTPEEYFRATEKHREMNFIAFEIDEINQGLLEVLKNDQSLVAMITTSNDHAMAALRRLFFDLIIESIDIPVVVARRYEVMEDDNFMIYSATDIGGLFIDGLGDGVMLGVNMQGDKSAKLEWAAFCNKTAFGILQATRNRMSKTEYISCPSCGRTLFDLQETTSMIRRRTDHLKGVKIGIMGCIVNGPGEMADADYGYVGSGPGRITLYRNKDVVKRNVPSAKAVDELIELIREDGNWIDPASIERFPD
ncbi:MAG TPA: (E)-4-hydroxy-3-methylbut-2-enyl-diphosphate synthase [Cyclobacteriaceae bacterium]|nr:(E)-4-hydroxy-3-methylbut-2-enyl-diphosphate synthase [Cyclobacteriaceae bacterium]